MAKLHIIVTSILFLAVIFAPQCQASGGNIQNQLVEAVKKEDFEAFRDLVCRGGDPAKPDSRGQMPLDYARHRPAFDHLVKNIKTHDLCRKDLCGYYPPWLVISDELADEGLPSPSDLPDFDKKWADPKLETVCHACQNGRNDCIKRFLKDGFDPNALCPFGGTLLSWASSAVHYDTVALLLKHGADPDRTAEYSKSSLFQALEPLKDMKPGDDSRTPIRIFELLLRHNANPNMTDGDKKSILFYAVEVGSMDAVLLLLERGARADGSTKYWLTPLMKAAEIGRLDIVLALLKNGAQINARTLSGETALTFARRKAQLEVVRALLDLGAK